MKIIEAIKFGAEKLKKSNLPSAFLDAEVLLSHTIKKEKEFLFTFPEKLITKNQENKYKGLIKRRTKYEPIAYLTGHKEFYGINFIVNKKVLIPRPETELLVEEVINFAKKDKLTILDVGTGSGAIAITLKKNLPSANIIATDISKEALTVAKKNAKLNNTKIEFIYSDLLDNIKNKKIDIIVANLPYVPIEEKPTYANAPEGKKSKNPLTEPLKYEPQNALYAGKYGLDSYKELFKQINNLKIQPKAIFCEIGHTYIIKTKQLTKKYFPNWDIEIKKDWCKKNRLLIIKKIS